MTKQNIITTLGITTLIITAHILITNHSKAELNKDIQEYKTCIQEQATTQGYIIRHYCSKNYYILDELAELEYIQKGYDLYLKQ